MLTIKEYVKVQSLEEAYELNQKRTNRILGGMLWMRMGSRNIQKAIDLSGLGLDTIEENEQEFRIGCMTSLRALETHEGLNRYTDGAIKESLRHIVGVQFRNLATVGGSLFGRFGFSDVLTMFLGLDSYVELYRGGMVPMEEFAGMKRDSDILVRVIVKKVPLSCSYQSLRLSKTDFPVIALCVSSLNGEWRCVVGARPYRAVVVKDKEGMLKEGADVEGAEKFATYVRKQVPTGKNMRASAEYRSQLIYTLTKRAVKEAGGCKDGN